MAFQFTAGVDTQMYDYFVTQNHTSAQTASHFGCTVDQLHNTLLGLAMNGIWSLPANKVSIGPAPSYVVTWLN
jgi:hypothetical protein